MNGETAIKFSLMVVAGNRKIETKDPSGGDMPDGSKWTGAGWKGRGADHTRERTAGFRGCRKRKFHGDWSPNRGRWFKPDIALGTAGRIAIKLRENFRVVSDALQ